MLRIRRYRAFVIFSVIFSLAFLQFLRSRDWSSAAEPAPVIDAKTPSRFAPGGSKDDSSSSHGFAPDSAWDKDKPGVESWSSKDGAGQIVNPLDSAALEKASRPAYNPDEVSYGKGETVNQIAKTPHKSEEDSFGTKDPVKPGSKPLDSSDDEKPLKPNSPVPPETTEGSLAGSTTVQAPRPVKEEFGTEGRGRVEAKQFDSTRPAVHWKKLPEHFPVPTSDIIHLPTGQPKVLPKLQAKFKDESSTDKLRRVQRLSTIKEAFEHSWKGYKEHALGHDEVRPVSGGYRDPFAGWGATLVDALDTLWIMDLKEEFTVAVDEVKKIDFTTSMRTDIPLFETVIRYLGGLIGAYDISGHKYPGLLDKALELAEILIGAFDTPNRMPITYYNWAPDYVSQPHRAGSRVVMAELGSLSVEFTRLAQLTQENKYYDAIARITDALETMQNGTKFPGMWPLILDASGCKKPAAIVRNDLPSAKELETGGAQDASTPAAKQPASADPQSGNLSKRDSGLDVDAQPADYVKVAKSEPVSDSSQSKCEKQGLATPPHSTSDTFGLGGQSDSTYEYLPKEYMLLGGLNDQYRGLYETAMDTVRKTLLFRPMLQEKQRDIRFTATVAVSQPEDGEGDNQIKYTYEGTHLTCFAGGMFAVGAKLFGLDGDMDIAAKLTDGCVWAYGSTTTGIMPEKFEVLPCEDVNLCAWNETRYHDALDPFEGARIQQAEQRYDRLVRIAKQAHETTASSIPEKPKAPKTPPLALPVIKSDPERVTGNGKSSERDALPSAENETGYIDLAKRDAHDDEEFEAYIARGPTKTAPQGAGPGSNTREEVPLVLPPKPSVLSHKEYVEARIKEERMPIGMTDIKSRSYILRPEAIESVFIMFRITGDEAWREKGWKMFEAISRYCRTDLADSAIKDVTSEAPLFANEMESFWLAETLKYFYLLFSDPSLVSLDEYVLNTEAHPFKRPIS